MKAELNLYNFVLIMVTTILLSACQPKLTQQDNPSQSVTVKVNVAKVINERITEWDNFTGRLEAPEMVTLIPRVSGYIEQVAFTEGAMVEAGDVLFFIDEKPFHAQLNRLKAELVNAESQAELTRLELVRGKKLKDKNAVSQEELDNRIARNQQANAKVKSQSAALEEAQLNLSYSQVKAPISGRVSRALITKGNYVTAGESSLTSLVSTDKFHAYFDVDEQTFLRYNRLMLEEYSINSRNKKYPVFMGLADDHDYPYEGYIDFMDNQLDRETGTIRFRAIFENIKGYFTPGLFSRLKVAGNSSFNGILIDDKAVNTDLNNKFVFVLDTDNKVQYRLVILGKKYNGLRLIKEGLLPDDKVVINGLQRIRAGDIVEPIIKIMADEQTMAKLRNQQKRFDALTDELILSTSINRSDERS